MNPTCTYLIKYDIININDLNIMIVYTTLIITLYKDSSTFNDLIILII